MQNIRVRFAPSPTGFVHIGSLRTALFNWLYARSMGGTCILRVEDTDRTRLVEGSVENLLSTFSWLGINFDEGPYFQSQRLDIYKKYALELVEKGHAYWCACSPARLDEMRASQQRQKLPPMYDGACREKNLKTGHVIRLKVPRPPISPLKRGKKQEGGVEFTTTFHDLVKGDITVENNTIDDQVLLKSDEFPTYHLAVVIDDHLMEISHVIRADEWLISTPKHVLLYKAFGWELPTFVHLPLILAPDKSKLSKRMGSVAVEEFRTDGYMPQALVNFVALLGWHPEGEEEIFSLETLIKQFSLDRIQKSPAIFDRIKLDWMNGQYLRSLDSKQFATACKPFLSGIENVDFEYITSAVATEQSRIKKLSEIGEATKFFFKDISFLPLNKGVGDRRASSGRPGTKQEGVIIVDPKLLIWKKSTKEETKGNLQKLYEFLIVIPNRQNGSEESSEAFKAKNLESSIKQFINDNALSTGSVLWPMRVALSGRENSPGPFEIAAVLGREKTLERLQNAINML